MLKIIETEKSIDLKKKKKTESLKFGSIQNYCKFTYFKKP